MKKLFILIFGLIFCFLLTTGVSAETTRAQRATAGLLYRYLVDTGRAN